MSGGFRVEPLSTSLDRAAFTSGVEPLDRYFRERVSQDVRRRMATAFVAVDQETGRIAGYYTLSAIGVPLGHLPDATKARLPRYPSIPSVLLGRLAVDLGYRGQGLGAALLADALARAAASEIGAHALVVDAKDGSAAAFYSHHGFVPFHQQPRRLFISIATALRLYSPNNSRAP